MELKVVTLDGLRYFYKKLNERLNDIFTAGLHQCKSCGAPYKGKPICEYCGRGFFVEALMYKGENNEQSI